MFPADWMSEEGEDFSDSLVAADTANDIVDLISTYLDYHEVLTQLLQERNLDGYTPFVAAVVYKVPACSHSPHSMIMVTVMCLVHNNVHISQLSYTPHIYSTR